MIEKLQEAVARAREEADKLEKEGAAAGGRGEGMVCTEKGTVVVILCRCAASWLMGSAAEANPI